MGILAPYVPRPKARDAGAAADGASVAAGAPRAAAAVAADAPGDAPWAAAAVRAAIPEATFVALLDARTGAVLLLDGGSRDLDADAAPVPAAGVATRREAGKLFAALGGDADASKAAFVVPALDATRTWIIGAGDADLLRDDDRAWVSRLLRASS